MIQHCPCALPSVVLVLVAGTPTALLAQVSAPTDIYLVEVRLQNGSYRFGIPVNVTHRKGYDNQPSFLLDGTGLLFASIGPDAQADIYRYDLLSRNILRLTATAESEYSPMLMPGGESVSVVRVERDSTQRLWGFPLEGRSPPRVILEAVKPVGYYAWVDKETVVVFVLGNPSTLQVADVKSGKIEVLARNIGRSIHRVPGRNAISFVQRSADPNGLIEELDLGTRRIRPLVQLPGGNEFYAWMPDGTLVTGQESCLYGWTEGRDAAWRRIADFTPTGMRQISRLAVSPNGDYVAIVAAQAVER